MTGGAEPFQWHNKSMETARVLLADDHAVVRAGIRNALEELPNLEVVGEVGDGIQLVQALETLRPNCLLIDVTMPDFEPITTIREIRATYPAMKILVVSAYDDDVYVQGLLGAGVNGYHLFVTEEGLNIPRCPRRIHFYFAVFKPVIGCHDFRFNGAFAVLLL